MKVIGVRGVSGSGKSHLVREIMRLYGKREEERAPGRRFPVGYWLSQSPTNLDPLFVPGYYGPTRSEDAQGVLWDTKELHDLVVTASRAGWSCLFETRSRNDDWIRPVRYFRADVFFPIVMAHDVSESVRTTKDLGGKIMLETARRHWKRICDSLVELRGAGYNGFAGSRQACLDKVRMLLT